MSYINEALTKAQKEKDKSSGNIQPVIVPAPLPERKRNKYGPVAVMTAVVVAAAAVVSVLYLWRGDAPSGKAGIPAGSRPPAVATSLPPPGAAATSLTGAPAPGAGSGIPAATGQPASSPPVTGMTASPQGTAKGVYQGPPAPGTVVAGTASPPAKGAENVTKQTAAAVSPSPAKAPPAAAPKTPASGSAAGVMKAVKPASPAATGTAAAGGRAGGDVGKAALTPARTAAPLPAAVAQAGQERERRPARSAASSQAGKDEEARLLYQDALASQQRRDHERAARLYSRLLEKNPRHVEALNNLGVIYMQQHQSGHAMRLFEQAIKVKPGYVDPYYNLACLYAQYHDVTNSVKYLKKAAAINPEVRAWAKADGDLRKISTAPEFLNFLGEGKDK